METNEIQAKIDDIFSRGAGDVIDPDGALKRKILAKANGEYQDDIIVKFGIDPNRPDIHLGHAVVFRKLRQLQELGCKVVFLVGDYTAQIGDPTGKSKIRPMIDQKEVEDNMKTFLEQVGKILKTTPDVFSWMRNSEWFIAVSDIIPREGMTVRLQTRLIDPKSYAGKAIFYESTRMQKTHLKKSQIFDITLRGLLWTLQHITHSRLVQRDMFQERIKAGEELFMHEMMYPVLQGIDSFMIHRIYGSCDLEVGGTDQTFNMIMGRDVMRINKCEEQAVAGFKILTGTDGKEKMSKSLDNYISITEAPSEMYGKVMSIPDTAIVNFFELATYTPLDDVNEMERALEKGTTHPKDLKMRLAREIVAIYHGEGSSQNAEEDFVGTFQKGGIPQDIPTAEVVKGSELVGILLEFGIVSSKTDFRRLVDEGAVSFPEKNGEKITDSKVLVNESAVIKVGKHRFLKTVVK